MLRIQNLQNKGAMRPAVASRSALVCRAVDPSKVGEQLSRTIQVGLLATAGSLLALQCAHAEVRMPPISSDPDRCARGYVGNTIGQANAVSDKILDLRKCTFKNANLQAKVLSGALLVEADLSGSNMREAVMSKAYAVDANFTGADMSNAVIDRVDFSRANLTGVKLVNAVVTGAIFDDTILTDSIWEDALVGNEDVKRLCKNVTLVGESRAQVGCRN